MSLRSKTIPFQKARKTFLGYLEGSHKARHTIESYKLDLKTFEEFLNSGLASRPVAFEKITKQDLDEYYEFLKKKKLRTNTRRRKLLTVRRFLRFLNKRNQFELDVSEKILAPYKVERVPFVFDHEIFLQKVKSLPSDEFLLARNRALLWTLAETGCLVSEAVELRYEDWELAESEKEAFLQIPGKYARSVKVSVELYQAVQSLYQLSKGVSACCFLGFNKFGPLKGRMSPRGVEIVLEQMRDRFHDAELTPRKIRHSVIYAWLKAGVTQEEIMKRLGLKSTYAFRVYEPLLKSELQI